jgi:hypothetical protein
LGQTQHKVKLQASTGGNTLMQTSKQTNKQKTNEIIIIIIILFTQIEVVIEN